MPKKPQATSPRHKLSSYKKFWLIFASSIVVIIGILLGSSLYETYHDRPLAKELQYVGREYNSGCSLFRIICASPESEFLYYATEKKPDDVVGLFPGWKLENKQESLWPLAKDRIEDIVYSLVSADGTRLATGYYYFPNKNQMTNELHLLPTTKPYIIMVNREEYDILRQADTK